MDDSISESRVPDAPPSFGFSRIFPGTERWYYSLIHVFRAICRRSLFISRGIACFGFTYRAFSRDFPGRIVSVCGNCGAPIFVGSCSHVDFRTVESRSIVDSGSVDVTGTVESRPSVDSGYRGSRGVDDSIRSQSLPSYSLVDGL